MTQLANPVKSINRVLDLVETLAEHPRGLLLSDISNFVALPKSTVHRLLLSLINRGYVAKEPVSGKYQLTMRMFEIGSRAYDVLNIMTIARPYCEHLADMTGEIVHLVKRDANDVVYLFKLDSSSASIRTASAVGLRGKMYCTGVGKAILANLPTDEVHAIWAASEIERFTSTTITDWDVLVSELKRAKTIGYALDNEEHEVGIRCIAAPILDFSGKPTYAMSISAPAARLGDAEISNFAAVLVSSTREISRFLGNNILIQK